jgi:hypothetical protein
LSRGEGAKRSIGASAAGFACGGVAYFFGDAVALALAPPTGPVPITWLWLAPLILCPALACLLSVIFFQMWTPVPVVHGLCARCSYDLVGNESGTCPVCGAPVSRCGECGRPMSRGSDKAMIDRSGVLK